MMIVVGLVGGFGPSKIAETFVESTKGVIFGALVVGLSRGVLIVMNEAQIVDPIVNFLANLLARTSGYLSAVGMLVMQNIINFFIPSGSGQAAATMPIMVPLADVLHINRQVAVLCFQFGDGFTNSILPVSGTMMAILAMAKIPYEKWLKFAGPLVGIWIALGGVFIVAANMFGYGPF